MSTNFLKNLWAAVNPAAVTPAKSISHAPQVRSTAVLATLPEQTDRQGITNMSGNANSGRVTTPSRMTELPSTEHSPLSRRPNAVTKMENGLGRTLSDAEREAVINSSHNDKRKKSKEALQRYSARELSKFEYITTTPKGDPT